MLAIPDLNLWAILASAVLSIAIGSVWYSPQLFGKLWMNQAGAKECTKEDMIKAYIGAFINSLVVATILATFIYWIGANTLRNGALVGFLAWLGFNATTNFSGVLWEKKPLNMFLVHIGCSLVIWTIIGALLATWR